MFQDLDASLLRLLRDPWMAPAFVDVLNADVSFETPDRTYAPGQTTLNLFLYEVKENRELRDNTLWPRSDPSGGFRLRRPPLRLDCAYVATAWSLRNGPAQIAEEHALLGQAMRWLSRFGSIPAIHLTGFLVDAAYPTSIYVAQSDPNRDAGDFWMAMGIPPRAAFYLLTTIAVDLDLETEVPLVTTTIAWYRPPDGSGPPRELININGFVFDAAGKPVSDVLVRLDPSGAIPSAGIATAKTDETGRYTFQRLARGGPYTLTAVKAGMGQADRKVAVPSPTGEYDVQLP